MSDDSRLLAQQSLSPRVAQVLTNVTKTAPLTQEITPRLVLQLLPWLQVNSGVYRVTRRKLVVPRDAKVRVNLDENPVTLRADALRAIALLRRADQSLLEALAPLFVSEVYPAGQNIVPEGKGSDKLYIIVRGKVEVSATGEHGTRQRLALLADGDHFGQLVRAGDDAEVSATSDPTTAAPPQPATWPGASRTAGATALTATQMLTLHRVRLDDLLERNPELREQLLRAVSQSREDLAGANPYGEQRIHLISGHEDETSLPHTYVGYEEHPREYHLTPVQTVLRVNTRVSDLYNDPMDQLREQVRLTVEVIKERQEWELINNPDFGLLSSVAPNMQIATRTGPPTPDDLDELLTRVWKQPAFFLAHPTAIAAFGRECTRRGVPPATVLIYGAPCLTWRGVPLIPSDKVPLRMSAGGYPVSDILLLRVGEQEQGVVGLHQAGRPDEESPSLSVRLMGIDDQAISSYLLSLYFSAAVLTDDALGVLHDVELGYYHDYR